MIHEYKTIAGPSTGEFKDKGSKFIAYTYPVETEEQAKDYLEQIRKEHPKSRHVCYALRVGVQEPLERANDDGEPSSSAGKPILGQLHSFDITNVLIAVVRYFGGTLLGVPGLINAYRTAAAESLEHNKIVTKTVKAIYALEMDYEPFHEVMNYLKRNDLEIIKQELAVSCYLEIRIESDRQDEFEQNMLNFEKVKCTFVQYE